MREDGIEKIVFGKREAMQAEYGTHPCYEGNYLVQPIGVYDYVADGYKTRKQAEAEANAMAEEAGIDTVESI